MCLRNTLLAVALEVSLGDLPSNVVHVWYPSSDIGAMAPSVSNGQTKHGCSEGLRPSSPQLIYLFPNTEVH